MMMTITIVTVTMNLVVRTAVLETAKMIATMFSGVGSQYRLCITDTIIQLKRPIVLAPSSDSKALLCKRTNLRQYMGILDKKEKQWKEGSKQISRN